MAKIFYISDLHLDFHIGNFAYRKKISKLAEKILPEEKGGDILIVPGDISHYNSLSVEFLKELKKYFKEIFVTSGNHDMYLISQNALNKYKYNSFLRIEEFKKMCEDNGIFYMEGNVKEANNIKICGLPGWYNVKNLKYWEAVMNDANYIYNGVPKIAIPILYGGVDIVNSFSPFEYFKKQFNVFESIKGKVDILFSHIPFIDVRKRKTRLDDFYWWKGQLSNFAEEKMKEISVKHYIFGHIHKDVETEKNGIKIHSCFLGYKYNGQKIKSLII